MESDTAIASTRRARSLRATTRSSANPLGPRFFMPAVLLFTACASDSESVVDRVFDVDYGDLSVELETRGHYSRLDALQLLQLASIQSETQTTSGFYLFHVRYETTGLQGEVVPVSGLLAVPDSDSVKGIVSWQHGTNPTRSAASSEPGSTEGALLSAVFAGNDFIFLAADYIGLGQSHEIPTYMHTDSTVDAVVDLLIVGSKVLEEFGDDTDLALAGFSQGGAATAGVQRRLQEDNPTGLDLKRAAALAGPYDLRNISIKYAIEQDRPFYLAYIANSYSHIYGGSMDTIIRDDYLDVVPGLFDGSSSYADIEAALPPSVTDLYTPEMLDDIHAERDNWFTLGLEDNETFRWVPESPLRLYYGEEDMDVSPDDAMGAFTFMRDRGGDVTVVDVGAFDHNQSAVVALPHVQDWFNNAMQEQP